MKLWNKIVIVLLIFLVLFIILGILYYNGYLDNLNWTTLTMIGAAAAGPYIMVKNWVKEKLFSESNDKIHESEKEYLELRNKEVEKRKLLNASISNKDQQIELLRKEVNILHIELKDLQNQRASVKTEVEKLSNEEIFAEFDDEF